MVNKWQSWYSKVLSPSLLLLLCSWDCSIAHKCMEELKDPIRELLTELRYRRKVNGKSGCSMVICLYLCYGVKYSLSCYFYLYMYMSPSLDCELVESRGHGCVMYLSNYFKFILKQGRHSYFKVVFILKYPTWPPPYRCSVNV